MPAALLASNLLLHKTASNLCDRMMWRWGFAHYDRAMLLAILAGSVVLGLGVVFAGRSRVAEPRGGRGRSFAATLIAIAAVTVLVQRTLLVANVELIHLPQYALLALALRWAGLPLFSAWIGATAGGVLDEVYQHLVIYAGHPETYLDFNDMVFNAIGAAWIIILLACCSGRPARAPSLERPPWGLRALAPGLAAGGALVLARLLDHGAYWHVAATGRHYHVLSLGEGLAAGVALGALVLFGLGSAAPRAIDPGS